MTTSTYLPDRRSPPSGRVLTRADFDRYAPVVRRTAMRVARKAPSSVTVEILIAQGFRGLLQALSGEGIGATPSDANVEECVRGAMLAYLQNLDPRVRQLRSISRKIARTMRLLIDGGDPQPPREAIAHGLGVSVEVYESDLRRLYAAGLARLELVGFDEDPHSGGDPLDLSPSCDSLSEAIDRLAETERVLLMLVFQEDVSLGEAGAVLGMSATSTEILFAETLLRLRAALGRE
ncbi:MAG: hypothetical protein U0271_31985 [Polyangiaceae bacterium]